MEPPEPESTASPSTPFDEPAPAVPPKKKIPKVLTFFERVQNIPRADWGERAKIKVYRLAPLINRLVGSENKYVTIYREPINEEKIKHDHGSGRYRLYLNYKPPGQTEQELDSTEFDILDPKYPPNVPPGEWIDDDRNKQWAWSRAPGMPAAPPPPPPPPATGVGELVNVLRVAGDMRREIREEMQPNPPTAPVAPAPVALAPPDPFDTAKKIMDMRGNDPMIALLMARMDAQDKAAEAARLREYELQKELRQQSNTTQAAALPKTLIEQLKELGEMKTLMATVFGGGTTGDGAPIRPGKLGWLDFARETLPEIVNSKILNSLADRIANGAAAPPVQFNPAAAQPVNGNGAAPSLDDTMKFVQAVVTPAMLEYFRCGEDGSTFAAWIHDGYPGRVAELQAFGEQRIYELYKQHAPRGDWAQLTSRGEPAFALFIHQFCTWKPEPDDEEPQGRPAAASGIIDLDADEDKGAES